MRRSLQASLELVRFTRGQIVAAPGTAVQHAYLPLTGLVALLATGPDGETVQVGLVGSTGIVGTPVLLHETQWPYAALVVVPGEAYRLRVAILLAASAQDATLQRLLFGCAQQQLQAMAQASVCHRFHSVQERLSGWLLVAARAAGTDTVAVTQDLLAQLLGAPRTVVSRAATGLEDRGLIRQQHGRVRILQRGGLRARACSCGTPFDDPPSEQYADRPPRRSFG
jgi:CRP-like cAMP-binding protein